MRGLVDGRQKKAIEKAGDVVATVIGSAIDSKRKLEDEASIDNPKIAGSSSNISSNNQKLSSSNNSRDLLDKLQKGRRTDARNTLGGIPKISLLKGEKSTTENDLVTAAEEKSERQRLGKKSNNNTVASDLVSSSTPSTASPHHQQSPSNQQENSTPFDQRHSLIGASARPSFTAPKTIILDTQLLEESKRLRFPAFTSVPEDFSAAVTDSSSPLVLNKVVAGKPKAVFGKASTGRLDEIKKEKPKIDATAELDVFLTGRKVETVKEPARSSQITRQQNLQKIKLVASDKDYYAINEKSTSINEYDQEEHIDGHRGDDDESRFHHHQTHHDDQNDDDDIYRSADYLNNDSKSSSLQSLQYRALAPLVVSEIMFEPLMPNNIFHSVNQVEEVTMRYARLLENKARALRGEPPLEEPVVPADQLARNVSKPNPTKDVVRSSKDSLAAVPITTSATENTVLPKTSTSDQQIPAPQSNLNETTASLIAAVDKPATSESTTTTTTKTTGNRPASDHSISAISGITTSGSIVIQPPMSSYDPMNNDLSTQTSRLPSVLPSAESSTYDHNAGSKISQYRIQKENEYSGLVGGSGLEEFAEEDSDVDDNDNILSRSMIVTSMKAIVDNRKRKLAEKEASSVRNSKTLKNSNGESSLSKEKEIIRFYYHQIPGSTEEDDIMENEEVIPPPNPIEFDDTKVLNKEHYSHYHSHAKSCDVETAHTLLEVVEAERVAMYEDENENSARPMTIDGQHMRIKNIPVATGSASIGMSWLPAPPRFSLPMKFYKHYTSAPNTPDQDNDASSSLMELDNKMAIIEETAEEGEDQDDEDLNFEELIRASRSTSTARRPSDYRSSAFEKPNWSSASELYGADQSLPFKPETVDFAEHGGIKLPQVQEDKSAQAPQLLELEESATSHGLTAGEESELDNNIKEGGSRKKRLKKKGDSETDNNDSPTSGKKLKSKRGKKIKDKRRKNDSSEMEENRARTGTEDEMPTTEGETGAEEGDDFVAAVSMGGDATKRTRPGTARLKLAKALVPGSVRPSVAQAPKVDGVAPESDSESESMSASLGKNAKKDRHRKKKFVVSGSNNSLSSTTTTDENSKGSGMGSSNLVSSNSLGSSTITGSASKRNSISTLNCSSNNPRSPETPSSVKVRNGGVMESPEDGQSRQQTPGQGKGRPGSGGAGPAYMKDGSKFAIDGPQFFELIHDVKKRHNSMNPLELSRYPTINDPESIESAIEGISELESVQEEVHKLSKLIDNASVPIPSNLRRRGMCYARMGKYEDAATDFNKAIKYDQFNTDAYWFRHQLNLRNGNIAAALKDLDSITDTNRQHFGAFQAKARIYQELGITKLAVVNFSQVIKLKPEDADGYLQRATLFESENENVYANEDYKMVRNLDPTNEKAITNLALYSFERQLWEDAAQAFSRMIQLTPKNAQAYMYRGRAYAYMAKWDLALQDLTMAIKMNPGDAKYYFYRGCLVKERNLQMAIEDFSIAIMLDDSSENTDAYYQRALLYYKMKKYDLAVIDYLSVIEMNPTKSVAYLNLGLMYMRYLEDYRSALECFEKAITHDPIQLRAYLCRGDLYQITYNRKVPPEALEKKGSDVMLNKSYIVTSKKTNFNIYLQKAVRDYSKCIHLCPGNYLLYLYRGRLLLQLYMMSESAYDFLVAFELNSGIAQTFVQRALVLSFQKKYSQIIGEYNKLTYSEKQEDPALHMLVAKAKLKCGDSEGALIIINYALKMNEQDAKIHLQKGICLENLKRHPQAIMSFSRAIELDRNYAKAYYRRGMCKLKKGDEKGCQDLDRAIKLDARYFDAYIARASYYHSVGRYAEGVEDCSKALKVEPSSIRAHLLRGSCKCELNQLALAISDFTKAISLDKNSHYAFYNRAISYQILNDYENAIKDYSIVLLISEDSNAYRNRGLIYWKQGDAENALLDLQAARDNFPQDAHLYGLLAMCLQKVGRLKESVNAFTEAIKLNSNMKEAYLGRGNIYASANFDVEARRDYAKVLHMYPRCSEAHINIAYMMQKKHRYKKAWELFNAVLASNPDCVSALEGRSVVHHMMGNCFSALVDISQAIKLDIKNAELLTNRGVIYQSLMDNTSALNSFKMALEVDPSYALAAFNAANLYYSHRRWDQAIEFYNRTLKLIPKDPAALLNRAITRVMLKDNAGALEDFERLAKLEPNSPQVFFNRAHLYQSLGRYEEAEEDYTRVIKLTPKDSLAFLRRGETRGKLSKKNEAMHDFTKWVTTSRA